MSRTARASPLLAAFLLVAFARAVGAQDVPADSSAAKPDSFGIRPDPLVRADAPSAEPVVLDSAGRTPGGALRRALLVPGWGQVYNGQPGKVPVVAGAMAGLAGVVVWQTVRYVRLRHAYLYVVNETAPDPTTPNPDNPYAAFFDDWVDEGARAAPTLRTLRDRTRRTRDLAILGTGLAYAVQALDAYVAAHLLDFDVGGDLSASVRPDGAGLALTVRF